MRKEFFSKIVVFIITNIIFPKLDGTNKIWKIQCLSAISSKNSILLQQGRFHLEAEEAIASEPLPPGVSHRAPKKKKKVIEKNERKFENYSSI